MKDFFKYYTLYKSSNDITDRFIKEPNGKTCRFCQKSYPTVSFNTKPHIIPELLGRNNITSNFECDDCNNKYSKYELDLSTFTSIYFTFLGEKTKKKIPITQSLKRDDEKNTTSFKHKNGLLNIDFGRNTNHFNYNKDKNVFTLNFTPKKLIPFYIYKSLLKIAIGLMPNEDLKNNLFLLDEMKAETPYNGIYNMFRYVSKTEVYKKPEARLFKANNINIDNNTYPEYTLTVHSCNVILQLHLPLSNKNNLNNKLDLRVYPMFVHEDLTEINNIEVQRFSLYETKKISFTDTITLSILN